MSTAHPTLTVTPPAPLTLLPTPAVTERPTADLRLARLESEVGELRGRLSFADRRAAAAARQAAALREEISLEQAETDLDGEPLTGSVAARGRLVATHTATCAEG